MLSKLQNSHESATPDPAASRRNERAKNQLEDYRMTYLQLIPASNFDQELWKSVKILSATLDVSGKAGTAEFSLIAPERYSNYTGNVHGGAVATILDGLTNCSIALIARKGFWDCSAVTRSLNISYVRPVEKGQKVVVRCEVVHASSRLVTIHGVMKRDEDGKVLAMCVQEMVAIDKSRM